MYKNTMFVFDLSSKIDRFRAVSSGSGDVDDLEKLAECDQVVVHDALYGHFGDIMRDVARCIDHFGGGGSVRVGDSDVRCHTSQAVVASFSAAITWRRFPIPPAISTAPST